MREHGGNCEKDYVTKTSLLAGVGFALQAMNREQTEQTGYGALDVSGPGFGAPRFSLIISGRTFPPLPPAGSNPVRPAHWVCRKHFRIYFRLQPVECERKQPSCLTEVKPLYDHLSPTLIIYHFICKGSLFARA